MRYSLKMDNLNLTDKDKRTDYRPLTQLMMTWLIEHYTPHQNKWFIDFFVLRNLSLSSTSNIISAILRHDKKC